MSTRDSATRDSATVEHCAVRVRASVSQLARRLRGTGARDGLGLARLSALGQLHRLGPMTPSDLAASERVKLQTLTRLLADLERDGLIKRTPHAHDGRQTVLALTRAGLRALQADVRRREAALAQAIDTELDAAERAALLQACALFDRIAESLPDAP